MTTRVAATAMLDLLNYQAIRRNYNRTLTAEFIGALDPYGLHLVIPVMEHEHAGGVRVTPHLRTRVLAKMRGSNTPQTVMLDMPYDKFDALPTTKTVLKINQDLVAAQGA